MARYDTDHKATTRRRILDTAARRMKTDGVVGSGVATLMKDASLTNGAFYAHFASKDDLVGAVLVDQVADQRTALEQLLDDGVDGLERFVREYLSAPHRDHPGDGCPTAALLEEVGRASAQVRQRYTHGLLDVVDLIASHLDDGDSGLPARARVLAAFAGMAGAVAMARALTDADLSDALLEQAVRTTLDQLGLSHARSTPARQ